MKNILRYIGNMSSVDIVPYIFEGCNTYVEPFAGSFGAGFNVMEQKYIPRVVLNDKDYFVYNFWYCIKENSDFVIENIRKIHKDIYQLDYVSAMKKLEECKNSTDKYIQAAYEYLYMENRYSFNSHNRYIKELNIHEDDFIDASIRLMEVDILNIDCLDILDRYDSDSTLFMMDPPYNVSKIDKYYRGKCSEFNHAGLREKLDGLKGKWIVRYNEEPLTADLYRDTKILFKTSRNLMGTEYIEVYYTNM